MSNKKLMTVRDIQDTYGIKPSTVRWWIRDGVLSHIKVGKLLFIKQVEIENLIEKNEINH